jgi:NAD(P)-dependent dehydrogenase (short-subunit alcohol dehydrogenase family)
LITGALTGIGRATATVFAKNGGSVVASGRREAEGKSLEAQLRSLGAEAAFIHADVRREDDVRSLIDQTVARFGRIDAAVNAAGTEGCPPNPKGSHVTHHQVRKGRRTGSPRIHQSGGTSSWSG